MRSDSFYVMSFWEKGNFSLKCLNLRKTSGLKPFSGIWKDTNLCNKGIFSFQFSCNFDDRLSQNCVKDQSSHFVYLNIYIKQPTCENFSSIGRRTCEILMKEKTPLSHEVVCFEILDFETSNSNLEVSKSNSWKITSFSKTK